jgi:hypothetical protein
MYVANSEPTIWQRGGGRAGMAERDLISGEPNRIGEPEAGQGTEGGRFTDSTEDLGPMKPGNRAEDKTLTIGKTGRRKNV